MSVRVGDIVLYVPDCDGDRCDHPDAQDRAAIVTGVVSSSVVSLAVLHPVGTAYLVDVPLGGPGQPRTWYLRPPASDDQRGGTDFR